MNIIELLDKVEKAEDALRNLEDEVLIQVQYGWKTIYGLVGGCLEQLRDVKEELESL